MGTTTAAIYARLSDDKRKGTSDEGLNVDEQIEACKAFIASKGWTVGKVYRDDSISATKEGVTRPDFECLLQDKPPVVVAWRASRLSRHVMDTLRIKTAGITGYLTDGGMVDFSSGDSTMLTLIRSAIDAAEGQKKAEFQKQANLRMAKAGQWHYSRPVFGNDRESGKVIPDQAEAIQHAAKLIAAEEWSFFRTAKEWNDQGFRTPKTEKAGGRLWEPGTVRNFFTSPRLIGKRVYDGETYVMKGWEPVLDEDTFNAIQELINANKTGKRGVQGSRNMPHLLTGIASCDVCGKGLNVSYRGGPDSTRAYRCTTPGHVSRVAEPFEKWVVEKFLYLLMHEGADRVVSPDTADSATKLRLERVKATKEHDAWLDEAVEGGLSPAVIGKKEKAHAKKLAELDAKLLEVMRKTSFADLLSEVATEGPEAMWKRWESIPMDKKRAVIQALFSEIVVKKAPQGRRFRPEYVTLRATDLMLSLTDLNSQPEEVSDELIALLGLEPL
jgi:DNA invertase Pin-like site-specific DNA recombinase